MNGSPVYIAVIVICSPKLLLPILEFNFTMLQKYYENISYKNSNMSNIFVSRNFVQDNISISANSIGKIDINIAFDGYTPFFVSTCNIEEASTGGTNQQYCYKYGEWIMVTDNVYGGRIKNSHSSAAAKIKVGIRVVFIKSTEYTKLVDYQSVTY